jgi:hypothetical protein
MGYKPSDLFIGIVSFFAIFLPGAFFVVFLLNVNMILQLVDLTRLPDAERYILFFLASYLFGHLVHSWAEPFRHMYKAKSKGDSSLTELAGLARQRASVEIRSAHEFADLGFSVLDLRSEYSLHSWCRSILRLKSGSATGFLDQLEAEQKVFRSLCLVLTTWGSWYFLLGGTLGALYLAGFRQEPVVVGASTTSLGLALVLGLATWAAFRRYANRRRRYDMLTLELYLALE